MFKFLEQQQTISYLKNKNNELKESNRELRSEVEDVNLINSRLTRTLRQVLSNLESINEIDTWGNVEEFKDKNKNVLVNASIDLIKNLSVPVESRR